MPATVDLYERLVAGVVARLKARAIVGVGDKVFRVREFDPENPAVALPCLVVSCFGEVETPRGGDHASDEWGVPVEVAIVAPTVNDGVPEARETTWREEILATFIYQRLPGVAEVTTCEPEPRAIMERASQLSLTDLMRSAVLLRFVCRKGRGP